MTCWVLLKGDLWERRDPIELLGVSGAPLLTRPAVHRCGADRGEWRADLRAVVTSEGRGPGTCRSTPARPPSPRGAPPRASPRSSPAARAFGGGRPPPPLPPRFFPP